MHKLWNFMNLNNDKGKWHQGPRSNIKVYVHHSYHNKNVVCTCCFEPGEINTYPPIWIWKNSTCYVFFSCPWYLCHEIFELCLYFLYENWNTNPLLNWNNYNLIWSQRIETTIQYDHEIFNNNFIWKLKHQFNMIMKN